MTLLTTLLLSFLIVLGAFGIMAIGTLHGRSGIRGSCGGIGSGRCDICGDDRDTRDTPVDSRQEKRI
jgi:hypothetical protein